MKKQNLQEALNKMKYLTEYHFKSHTREDSFEQSENPVSFDEIGDVYKHEEPKPEIEETDFPTWDEYRDEVIIDEDDIEGEEQPQPEEQPQAAPAAPQAEPAPIDPANGAMPPAPMDAQAPAPQAEPAPMPEPQPEPQPEPAPMPEPTVNDTSGMDSQMSAQMAKQDEILAQLATLTSGLMAVQNVSQKIDTVANDIEELKNPSYDAQHDLISKQSFPYNVKLSDFWGWGEEGEEEQQPEEFTATPEEISSYNKEDIKQSFR